MFLAVFFHFWWKWGLNICVCEPFLHPELLRELLTAFILLTLCFCPFLNISCIFAPRPKGWMSWHKKEEEGKKKNPAETTQECHSAIQSARPGQANCRKATSLWSPPRQLWTLDALWHGAAKPDHISLVWWENQTNGSLEVYFGAAILLSKLGRLHGLVCTDAHALALSWIARRVQVRSSNKGHIHLF